MEITARRKEIAPSVTIRPLQEGDALTSVRWRNDPEIWKLTGSAPDRKITIADETAWIRRVIADPTCRRFAILADGDYVGNIYLTDISGGAAQYHVFIGERDQWGRGIARKASELILAEASRMGLETVHLEVRQANAAAVHLYRSLGFEEQGQAGDTIRMAIGAHQFGFPVTA